MDGRRDVLEDLRRQIGCVYISDMRLNGSYNLKARACLETLDQSAYAPDVWNEAVRYLDGPAGEKGSSPVCPP